MEALQYLAGALTQAHETLRELTVDLKQADYDHVPCEGANNVSWIVEHLAQSDRDLLARLGVQVPTDHLAFDELRPRLVSAVRKLDPDRLDQRVDAHPLAGTLGSLISLAAVHTAFHTGQVSTIRRSLGYPPKF